MKSILCGGHIERGEVEVSLIVQNALRQLL